MRKSVKIAAGLGLALVLLLGLSWALFQVSKARDFQFFGEIVSRVETADKVLALTFDDGPTEQTPALLALLKREKISATFFLVGSELAAHPQWGREIAAAGHEIGNHSYTHQRMVLKSPGFVKHELEATDEQIRRTGYTGPLHFRPPYGKKLFVLPWYLARQGKTTIMWDIEPETWPQVRSTPERLIEHVMSRVKPGSILLLHPMGDYMTTRQALPGLIQALKAQGYRFVSVSELLALRP